VTIRSTWEIYLKMPERDVEKFFKSYGRVSNVILKGGYGFCEFDDLRDAQDAVKDLDGKTWMGARVKIQFSRDSKSHDRRDRSRSPQIRKGNPPGRKTGYKVIVENLSSRTSWQDLKDFMRQAGEITYTNTHHQRSGEGVVEFGSQSDMEYALDKLDDAELDGRRIKLIEENKKSRSRSRERSGRGRDNRSRDRGLYRDKSRDRGGNRDRSRDRVDNRDRSKDKSRSHSNRRSRSRS